MSPLAIAAFALSACSVIMLGVLVTRRTYLAGQERHRSGVEDRLKLVALELVHEGGQPPADLNDEEKEALADLLGRYARATRGPSHEHIVEYFEREGTIERELAVLATGRRGWRRATAAFRLGDIGNADAAGGLVGALGDPDRDVRIAAARSLGRLRAPEAGSALVGAAADGRVPPALARWALLQIGTPTLPQLRALLSSEEERERASALQLIGLLGAPSDAEAVQARLRDTSALVRAQAALALGRLGSARNLEALMATLEDRIPDVRVAAASALGYLGDPGALEALLERVDRDDFDVAGAAAHAVARIDPAAATAHASEGASVHLLEAVDLLAVR
jgi:HEAT repeats